MQYPIIDLIADAYLNNGWTGNSLPLEQGGITDSTGIETSSNIRVRTDYLTIDYINVIYGNLINEADEFVVRNVYYYNNNKQFLASTPNYGRPLPFTKNMILEYAPSDFHVFRFVFQKTDPTLSITPQTTLVTINGTFVDNFSHRLKPPLPHYFPHPVIDALQRAAAGTQTADDTEILRHYLTPLGIGGI